MVCDETVAQGMDPDTVMDMMTEKNAQILGVADKVGRLEEGMLADLVIWSANPVKTYQAQAVLCMADGQVVFQQEAPAYERKRRKARPQSRRKNSSWHKSFRRLLKNRPAVSGEPGYMGQELTMELKKMF